MNPLLLNKPALGRGIYTPPDISLILRIPSHRIRWYISEVWDDRFGRQLFHERYSWKVKNQRAVNFLVLIEFKVVHTLHKMGISTQKILKARNSIAKAERLAYPFASAKLLANRNNIWYRSSNLIVDADGTEQLNFARFVEQYCKNIEFGADEFAQRFWPDGKDSSVVVDPNHQFGQPVIEGTNITVRTLFAMHSAGEKISTLSQLYEIEERKVKDAITFYRRAA